MPTLLSQHLDFIHLEKDEQVNLPLFTVCSQEKIVKSLKDRKFVQDRVCRVFKKRIIYTFYGASKYKTGETFGSGSKGDRSSCLILSLDHCTKIWRIYPLDTGLAAGIAKKRNGEEIPCYIINWETIEEKLNLGERQSRVNKMILHCFESLEQYLTGKVSLEKENKVKARFPDSEIVSGIGDMHTILTSKSTGDDRRYAVEVLFEDEIELMPEVVVGAITSHSLLSNNDYVNMLKSYRIEKAIRDNTLYYSSDEFANGDIEKVIEAKSIEFSRKKLPNNVSKV